MIALPDPSPAISTAPAIAVPESLIGQKALVTGANSGIGRGVALALGQAGADVVVTLRMDTFIPAANRYLSQQGKPVVGQVQRLGVRLDWAELRPAGRN